MTRVGFVLAGRTVGWLASWTYYRNLLHSIDEVPDSGLEPVVFVGERGGPPLADFPAVELHRSRLLDRLTPPWARRATERGLLLRDRELARLLGRHDVALMSHSGHLGREASIPTLGWVPDLQHRHLPDLFDRRTWLFREARYRLLSRFATRILVQSQAGNADLLELAPDAAGKVDVLPFVITPVPRERQPDRAELDERYALPDRYLHLPNQFWVHKNHRLVIEALRLLRGRAPGVQVVATGVTRDRRRPAHFPELMARVRAAGVSGSFRVLGVVPYEHVTALIREAVALVNPSLFEGWSTTVEEAKSLGKRVLLSDIPVHREQDPPGGEFFDPADPEQLAEVMWEAWTRADPEADKRLAERAAAELPERRQGFVAGYAASVGRAIR